MNDNLKHYGIPRKSGRYPWGSGENPYQRSADFIAKMDGYKAEGYSETEIAEIMGITTTQLRIERQRAHDARQEYLIDSAKSMQDRGMTNTDIAKKLGVSEGSVRNYIKKAKEPITKRINSTSDMLEDKIEEVKHLDVGVGVERQLGISRNKLRAAVDQLKEKGYHLHEIYIRRLEDHTKWTTVTVLSKESDLEKVKQESHLIRGVEKVTPDGGVTWNDVGIPKSMSSDRIEVAYAEDGGPDKDGLIEIRPGAEGLDLGNSKYAQVRIAVDDTHFMKGMAIENSDLPKGVDVRYNVTKSKETHDKLGVMKKLETDPDNPFGSTINDQKGHLNIINEEGDWDTWSKTLSSQFLSKQPVKLIRERLNETFDGLQEEYNDISSLTNSAVSKHLLESYIDDLGAKQRHLKVQGLPRTKSHVLIPYPDMEPREVYAPNYRDGERVVLVRHPHGGRFEIPELIVNNKHKKAREQLGGDATDAIGLHPSMAEKMSGADFDGDTVLVIPNNNQKVKSMRSLTGLKNFDPMEYQVDRDTINDRTKDIQMGIVSNLITDMTVKGATPSELARAVRHSMVVIDSEKHKLDYKQSARDNAISALQDKYQKHTHPVTGKTSRGKSTLISRSKGDVPGETKTNPITGREEQKYLVDMFDDAKELSSGTAIENSYADYINKTKSLQNEAVKKYKSIENTKYSPEAKKLYSKEVTSLDTKLNRAKLNAPRERQAQIKAANYYYENRKEDMSADDNKKLKSRSIAKARAESGANKQKVLVDITDKEWEAIQQGAVSNTKLKEILNNTDMDRVRELATPRDKPAMTSASTARARSMLNKGYTYAEVADALGVSASTIRDSLQ